MIGYVVGGYLATAALLGLYTWRILRRGRVLHKALGAGPVAPPRRREDRP